MESNTWTYYIADEDKPSAESEEGFHSLAAYVLWKDREYLLTLNSFTVYVQYKNFEAYSTWFTM